MKKLEVTLIDFLATTKIIEGQNVTYHSRGWYGGLLEFPNFGILLKVASRQGSIYRLPGDPNEINGYCGNNDGNEENELIIPLNPQIYGSLEHVYSEKQCKGKTVGWLPFAECPMVARRKRDIRDRRNVDQQNCAENAENKCQAIIGK